MSKTLDVLRDREQFDQIYSRVYEAAGARTQVELAEKLGIRQSSISDAKKNYRVPASWILSLYLEDGWNPNWLVYGDSPRNLNRPDPVPGVYEESAAYGEIPSGTSTVLVQSVEAEPDEDGQWVTREMGRLGVPKRYDRPDLLVVRTEDVTMQPAIRKGAFGGLDKRQTDIREGEIYGVFVPHLGLVLRRIFLDVGNGSLVVRSEMQDSPQFSIPLEEKRRRVIGRVVWVVQEM